MWRRAQKAQSSKWLLKSVIFVVAFALGVQSAKWWSSCSSKQLVDTPFSVPLTQNSPFLGSLSQGEKNPPEVSIGQPQSWKILPIEVVEEKLLVIIIAGGTRGLTYPPFRAIWEAVAEAVKPLGVYVYLVSMNLTLREPIVNKQHIIFPGKDSLIPGVLNETVMAFDYVYEKKLPGHKAPFCLRSNLSSFWQFDKLLEWLRGKKTPLLAARIGKHHITHAIFPSGAGTLMSRDLCDYLLAFNRSALLGPNIDDDLAIGEVFYMHNITAMLRNDFVDNYHLRGNPLLESPDVFHYRIKGKDELRDIGLMTWMFSQWYKTDRIIQNPLSSDR